VYFRRRAELTHLLRGTPAEGFDRVGMHETLGAITLRTVLETLASHEEEHLAQMEAG